ncbi:MAG TPA: GNAT family N-acetyltransferase [Candidatus Binatia bacterium]|nr:GNAT family N-acetyltransferase [Candidatus Binatia bacterium]
MLLTPELAEAIRRAEIAGIRCGLDTARRLRPDTGVAGVEIAGGLAAFFGPESPVSEAFGVGTSAPVTAAEIAAITEFYESRASTARVFVSPLAHPTLGVGLAAAGYAPAEYENVLASGTFEPYARRDDRLRAAADLHAWARASAAAFLDGGAVTPEDEHLALTIAASDGVTAVEGIEDGSIVATGAMDVRGDCAALFAASTMPGFRGRGWHLALIADRIARARDAGARFLRATARPGSVSERNFHRCGFTTLYTRLLWERKRDTNF